MHLVPPLVLLAVLASTLGAQRARLTGVVRDVAGKPWQDARVVLHGRRVPGIEWVGKADRVTATTDARGRFQAELLRDRPYVAWAVSAGAGPTYRVTKPAYGVTTDRPLRLTERVGEQVRVRVGLEAGGHAARGPFRLKITSACSIRDAKRVMSSARSFAIHVFDGGAFGDGLVLPALPWHEVTLEVWDAGGARLHERPVLLDAAMRRRQLREKPERLQMPDPAVGMQPEEMESLTRTTVRLPEPKVTRMRVVDDQRKPVRGAEVFQRVRGRMQRLTAVDDEGNASTTVAKGRSSIYDLRWGGRFPRIVVRAKGRVETARGADPVMMYGGRAVSARLVLGDEALSETHLIVWSALRMVLGPVGTLPMYSDTFVPTVVRTDRAGAVRIGCLPAGRCWLLAVLSDEQRERLGGVAPYALVYAGGTEDKTDRDLGDVDLAALQRFDFRVRTRDGTPVTGARVLLYDMAGGMRLEPLARYTCDRQGRLSLLAPPSAELRVIAHGEEGFWIGKLDPKKPQVDVRTLPATTIAGVVRDGEDKPVPDLAIHTTLTSIAPLSKRDHYLLTNILVDRFKARTDRAGRFSLWVLGEHESLVLRIGSWTKTTRPQEQVVDVDGTEREVEIEYVPRRR